MKRINTARLVYGDSEKNADFYYATRFMLPDPTLWLEFGGVKYLVLNSLEIDRGRGQAQVDHIISLDDFIREQGLSPAAASEIWIPKLLMKYQIGAVEVPSAFPLGLSRAIEAAGIKVIITDPIFPRREFKGEEEIKHIIQGQRQAEAGLLRGMEVLRASRIKKRGALWWSGGPLTSERLRFEIDHAVHLAGGEPAHTIVAGGRQACDPHEQGSGRLKSNELIIMDIFPYDQKSGYFGDLTRTVVKGKASEAQRHMRYTVRKGQRYALKRIKAGVDGKRLQQEVKELLAESGYPTEQRDGRWVGFFHGLGHGLGLEIHEAPRIAGGKLKTSQVITVEPGLYDPEIGGVRLEDVVVVEKGGCRNLTKAPFAWEIS